MHSVENHFHDTDTQLKILASEQKSNPMQERTPEPLENIILFGLRTQKIIFNTFQSWVASYLL